MISSRWDKRELEVVNYFYDQLSKNGASIEKIVFCIKGGLDEDLKLRDDHYPIN